MGLTSSVAEPRLVRGAAAAAARQRRRGARACARAARRDRPRGPRRDRGAAGQRGGHQRAAARRHRHRPRRARWTTTGCGCEVGDGSPHLPVAPPLRRHRRHRPRAADARVDGRRLGRDPAPRRQDRVVPDLRPADDLRDAVELRGRPARRLAAAGATTWRSSCGTCRCCCTPPGRSTPRRCCASTSWPASTTRATDPIQMHADATDAIAVLEEHVPRTAVAMSPTR